MQIYCSSEPEFESSESRISGEGWMAMQHDNEPWIMVDLETVAIIQQIITRKIIDTWVTEYSIGMILGILYTF